MLKEEILPELARTKYIGGICSSHANGCLKPIITIRSCGKIRARSATALERVCRSSDPVVDTTNKIVEALGEVDLEVALTVVCNLAGQLVAELSDGKPSLVAVHGESVAENIKKAALIKLLHDDAERRRVRLAIHLHEQQLRIDGVASAHVETFGVVQPRGAQAAPLAAH